jgi:hypothetical protein
VRFVRLGVREYGQRNGGQGGKNEGGPLGYQLQLGTSAPCAHVRDRQGEPQ